MKKYLILIFSLALLVSLSGCGKNIFSNVYSPDSTENRTAAELGTYAQKALIDGDFQKAVEYYEQSIAKDSTNSENLLGYAQAQLGASGFSVGGFITDALSSGSQGAPAFKAPALSSSTDPGFGLFKSKEDLRTLKNASGLVAWALGRIADGEADGIIKSNDIGVNMNIAVYQTLYLISDAVVDLAVDSGSERLELFRVTGPNQVDLLDSATLKGLPFSGKRQLIEAIQKVMIAMVGSELTPALEINTVNSTITVSNTSSVYDIKGNLVDGVAVNFEVRFRLAKWTGARISGRADEFTAANWTVISYIQKVVDRMPSNKLVVSIKDIIKQISGDKNTGGMFKDMMNTAITL